MIILYISVELIVIIIKCVLLILIRFYDNYKVKLEVYQNRCEKLLYHDIKPVWKKNRFVTNCIMAQ